MYLRERHSLQVCGVRHRSVGSKDSFDRCVEITKAILNNRRAIPKINNKKWNHRSHQWDRERLLIKGESSNQISAPTPCWGKPSSTVTSLLVLRTEALMVALSSGLIDRKLITCASFIDGLELFQLYEITLCTVLLFSLMTYLNADSLLREYFRSLKPTRVQLFWEWKESFVEKAIFLFILYYTRIRTRC